MRFPKLAKRIRGFSHEADFFLEQKWRDWSDIIDRKCKKLADFLDPPRKESEREVYGPPRPYQPGQLIEFIRETLAQHSNRNVLLDKLMGGIQMDEETGPSSEDGRITKTGQEFKIPLREYVVKCGHEYQPIGGIRMFEGAHETRSSKMMKCSGCGKLEWEHASGGEGVRHV